MEVLLVLVPVFALGFGGVAVLAWLAMEKGVGRFVVDRHRTLELLSTTDEVPEAWRRLEPTARLRRLDRLRRYVERTALVDSEATRQEVLARLAEVRVAWSSADSSVPVHADRSRPAHLDGRRPRREAWETRDVERSDPDRGLSDEGRPGPGVIGRESSHDAESREGGRG